MKRPQKDDLAGRLDLLESVIFGHFFDDGIFDKISKLSAKMDKFERIATAYVAFTLVNTTLIFIMLVLQLATN